MANLILHEDPISGNCYKIRLTAALVNKPISLRSYDIRKGETRTPEFLKNISAAGQIPVLQIGGDKFLPESDAACWYLAEDTHLIPKDPFARAKVLRWMFFEQNKHEINIAVLRNWLTLVGEANLNEARRVQIPEKKEASEAVLSLLDEYLEGREYLVGNSITVADVVLFAYTHVANEAGFPLERWPSVKAWCERIEKVPGFVSMSA